ncbi:MAG: gliding motility-associated C-terminal domain-containing protein [Endomicrobiales bacterium]|nr:gliding motility-associated C-terminal domain-containing protein [Endomicrobiales bacterium]
MKIKKLVAPLFVLAFALLALNAHATVLDSMQTTGGWTVVTDTIAAGLITTQSISYNSAARSAVMLDYTLGGGNWVTIQKEFSSVDLSAGDALKFSYKGTGPLNNLKVKLIDADGTIRTGFVGLTNQSTWKSVVVNFRTLTDTGTAYGYPYADAYLDLIKIMKIEFVVEKVNGGQGTIAIDNLQLYIDNPADMHVDNYDNLSGTNRFGGASGIMPSATECTESYVSSAAVPTHDGSGGSVRIDFNVSAVAPGWGGYWTSMNAVNFSSTTHLSFWVKGGNGGEKFKIELRGGGGAGHEVRVNTYKTLTTSWQNVIIPFSDFTGIVTTGPASTAPSVDQLSFVFERSAGAPYTGTVFIEGIHFLKPGSTTTSSLVRTLDDMSLAANWTTYIQTDINGVLLANPGTFSMENVTGSDSSDQSHKATQVNFNLNDSEWLSLQRGLSPNLVGTNRFKIYYMGTGTNNSENIEFFVTDKNNTTYKRVFYAVANTYSTASRSYIWKTLEIPLSEMSLETTGGSDGKMKDLDLTGINSAALKISRSIGSSAVNSSGVGTIYFAGIDFVNEVTPLIQNNGAVLDNMQLPYNPISPNGDGIKEKAMFSYKLKEAARVKIEVFSTKGESVWSYDAGDVNNTNQNIIEWDASDKNGQRVSNGIYIYKFTAEGIASGNTDTIKNLIGVIR